MRHDLDDDLIVPPDRRPLVYGGAAIVILIVAAFLFWPRGGDSPTTDPLANKSLTPPGAATQASDESVRTDAAAMTDEADADPTDVAEIVDDAVDAPTGTPTNPVAETRIVEEKPKVESTRTTQAETTPAETTPTRRSTPAPNRVRDTPGAQPATTGDWVLNVGSFSSRENADRRAEELTRQGITSHVQLGTSGNGSPVYRVRVGYFGSSADAKTYGSWLKTSQGLDSWASRR